MQLLDHNNEKILFDYISMLKNNIDCPVNPAIMQIGLLSRSFNKVYGDYAELGVFKGLSAKVINFEMDRTKDLYLFDTFEGLPKVEKIDDERLLYEGLYKGDEESVRSLFSGDDNVYIIKGIFPKGSEICRNKTFAFVYIDTDLYSGTIEGLNFFYPRLSDGGGILIDDYTTHIGVKKAVDEFCEYKKCKPIFINYNQVLLVK